MGLFFVYMLKSSVCLAGLYLFYRLLLSGETFHRFNRGALLGLLVFSCLIPWIEISVKEPSEVAVPFISLEEVMTVAVSDSMAAEAALFPWRALLLAVYCAGVLFFVVRHLWSLCRMVRLIGRCRKTELEDGIVLYIHNEKVAPFSWMKSVVISEEDWGENGNVILKHECAHVRNGHSWDLLLAEACIFFQWFNPAAWLLKQELQNVHEYEADEWVISQGIDAKKYQLLLIKKAVGARLYSIANSFNHSSLKKRITMMIKKKSNPWARMKYLYVLPLAAVAAAAFARPEVSNELNEISIAKVNDLTSIVKAEEVKSAEFSSEEKIKVSGKVVDDKSNPIFGASVLIKGTTTGTMTDRDGKFELEAEVGSVVLVSYVGLQTQSVIVKDTTPLKVLLQDDIQSMEEMVVVAYEGKSDTEEKKSEVSDTQQSQGKAIFTVVEEMPQFPGGMQEAMRFLANHIKYPKTAQEAGIQGRVVVGFLVEKDGSITDIKVVRSVSPELDAEAVRVIGLMPNWTPGKQRNKPVAVKYTMPVVFRLQGKAPGKNTVHLKVKQGADTETVELAKNMLRSGAITLRTSNGKSPLVVVDGKVQEKGGEAMKSLSPESIEFMTVLKDKAAMELYGDKGKDGVIEITTKK